MKQVRYSVTGSLEGGESALVEGGRKKLFDMSALEE